MSLAPNHVLRIAPLRATRISRRSTKITVRVSAGPSGQTYILCPNTTFETACGDDGGDLFISQSGTTVQCGADGSSKNQCNFQRANGTEGSCVWVLVTEVLIDIKLQGLTFQGVEGETPLRRGIVSMRQNEVTLEDCHWKVRRLSSIFSTTGVSALIVSVLASLRFVIHTHTHR